MKSAVCANLAAPLRRAQGGCSKDTALIRLAMPADRLDRQRRAARHRRAQRPPVQAAQLRDGVVRTAELARNNDAPLVIKRPSSVVEQFVQRRRQRETVVDGRRAALAVPVDVRRFEAEERTADQGLEPGDGATVVVGSQYVVAEGGAARATLDQLGAHGGLELWRLGHEIVRRREIPHGGEVLQTDGLSRVGVQ